MASPFPAIKVNLRDENGHPEVIVAALHIVSVQAKVIVRDGMDLDRADIVTDAGWTIRTTQTYQQVLNKLRINLREMQ